MFKSIRQSMAWLHGWLGLVLGWFIFIIFLTGTTAYYKDQLNLWTEPQIASTQYNQYTAIQTAYDYLQQNVNNADEWYINLAIQNKPINHVYWLSPDNFGSAVLDPNQGDEILLDNEIGLGQFFYQFHFQLHSMDILTARTITSFIAFIALIILISGVITHKKIFSDFFTLRTYKGQRSWLDVHNISAVIILPFLFTVTFTGLMLLFNVFLPQGLQQLYGDNTLNYYKEIREKAISVQTKNNDTTSINLPAILAQVQQQWGEQEIKRVVIKNINQPNTSIYFEQVQDDSLTLRPNHLLFNKAGNLLESNRKTNLISLASTSIYGLHLAYFAQPIVRFALFLSGLLATIMVASGLLMWSIKRQIRHQGEESTAQYLVDRINISILVGLPIAMVSAFYAVRLHSLIDPDIVNISFISSFFSFWIMSASLALLLPQSKLWIVQLLILTALCLILPIFDAIYLIMQGYVHNLSDYWLFLRIDIFFIIVGILAILFMRHIRPIQNKISAKTEQATEH